MLLAIQLFLLGVIQLLNHMLFRQQPESTGVHTPAHNGNVQNTNQ